MPNYQITNITRQRTIQITAPGIATALARALELLPKWRGDDLVKITTPNGLTVYGRADMRREA